MRIDYRLRPRFHRLRTRLSSTGLLYAPDTDYQEGTLLVGIKIQ
jgi:hypothetical protein